MKHFLRIAALLALLVAPASAGTIYVDTAGANGGLATNSGTTDTTTATASGTAATVAGTTVTLDVSTNLGTVVTTPGPTQTAINIAGATNANRTIFWITSVTSGCTGTAVACVIVVDVAPTGVTTNSWSVGGRYLWPSGTTANVIEGAIGLSGGQDIVQFNTTPSTRTTGVYFTARNAGTSTTGLLTIQGKTGVRPVLQLTGATGSALTLNQSGWKVSNLEIKVNGTGDALFISTGALVENVVVSQCGGIGINTNGIARVIGSEVSSCTGDGIQWGTTGGLISGNYIHGNGGDGIESTSAASLLTISNNLITGNTGRGIFLSAAATAQTHNTTISGNTIYGNSNSGIEVTDTDAVVSMVNNIVYTSAAAVSTVKWAAGSAELFGYHAYNVFWQSNSSTSGLSGVTLQSTEFASDPLFVNAGAGDFAIGNSSPAAATGTLGTPINSSSTGYRDIGAFQRIPTTSGGGIIGG